VVNQLCKKIVGLHEMFDAPRPGTAGACLLSYLNSKRVLVALAAKKKKKSRDAKQFATRDRVLCVLCQCASSFCAEKDGVSQRVWTCRLHHGATD
jgi:hypothetical protein